MPVNISDVEIEGLGDSTKNLDYQTLDVISRMPFDKARMADIIDPQTKRDISFQVKRSLSTLAALIGRKLKYYNHKDYPTQVPEGQVGFAVISENTNPLDVQGVLKDLEAWRVKQAEDKAAAEKPANGAVEAADVPAAEGTPTPDAQGTPEDAPQTTRGRGR